MSDQRNPGEGGARVLMISSNGAGMGHLTRLLAMSRRCAPGTSISFASMSQAVPVVANQGYPWEYLPSVGDLGIGNRRWNAIFARRISELVGRLRPDAIVFDGVYPYDGLLAVAREYPSTAMVWSRRGMWRPGAAASQLSRSGHFGLILEPGELAAAADAGATASRNDALRVGPITLLDPIEHLDREEAAAALGLDPSRPTALVTMGAGRINDVQSDVGRIVAALSADPELQIVLTRPVIAGDGDGLGERVRSVSIYPIAKYLAAIDLAVAAAGYNSFHELLGAGVPTIFVPNQATGLDDQLGRARWAHTSGVGWCVQSVPDEIEAAVSAALEPGIRREYARAARACARPNGAPAAMAAIEQLVGGPGDPDPDLGQSLNGAGA